MGRWDSQLFLRITPNRIDLKKQKRKLLHSDIYRPLPICAQWRPFCFPHLFLCITLTSLSRAFYFGLGLIFFSFSQRCKARHSSTALLNKCLYFSFLRAAGILVFNESFFFVLFPFSLVLHETSGTLIVFFLNVLSLKKKMKRWTVRSVV